MLTEYALNIPAEIEYARKWAFSRNPAYYNFDNIGGDCTNFISQCIYAGGAVMNFTRDTGWYYRSLHDRAAAWTSVQYFYQFMMNNKGVGAFGHEINLGEVQTGDVIQLGTGYFQHSLLVGGMRYGMPYVAAHTADAFNRPLTAYRFDRIRCLRINKARRD